MIFNAQVIIVDPLLGTSKNFQNKFFHVYQEVKCTWWDSIQHLTLTIHVNHIFLLFESFYYFENVIKLLSEHYQVFQPIPMLTEWGIIQKCLHVIIPKFLWFATLCFVLQVIFIFLELHSNYLTIIFFTFVTALSNLKRDNQRCYTYILLAVILFLFQHKSTLNAKHSKLVCSYVFNL